jgi:cell division protein ZapA (FtsZ GTPase activity inhibitor)
MSATEQSSSGSVAIKILGQEYRLKSEADPEHLQTVASYVDSVLRELTHNTPDTQDAAILAALNIASELLRIRKAHEIVSRARIQALIDFVDSA